ncbi:MAG TPA: hypothetical protein VKR56_10455 [Candidatus Cybelea sp.]|nr:hypothetical protein [Candidatus Cybelea sp.]
MRAILGGSRCAMLAACAFLTACGTLPLPLAQGDKAGGAARGGSWMRPEAKNKDLLYVVYPTVDSEGTIDAYSYPQGVLEGQITGLSNPGGDCTDAAGNLYVTNATTSENSIVEFAHGGTQPIRSLSVPGYAAFSCAVDPTSGDLAVTSYGTMEGGRGDVAVYHNAKGSPRIYSDSNLSHSDFINYAYCAYDSAGDLFVDGKYPVGYEVPIFGEVPRGGKSLVALNLNEGIGWISGLQWDGKYLAVGQAVKPYIFRFKISGTTGTLVGSTPLTDATDAFQFVFAGNKVIVANQWFYDRYEYEWDVLVYNYPKGGTSTERIAYKIGGSGFDSIALSRRDGHGGAALATSERASP